MVLKRCFCAAIKDEVAANTDKVNLFIIVILYVKDGHEKVLHFI